MKLSYRILLTLIFSIKIPFVLGMMVQEYKWSGDEIKVFGTVYLIIYAAWMYELWIAPSIRKSR